MVQFHRSNYYHREYSDYWKINSGQGMSNNELRSYLDSKKFTCKSKRKQRLLELYVKCQRGFMSYEGCAAAELMLFIERRGLPDTTDQKRTVSTLRAQLEQADEEATFDQFFHLPPEIRCQIYEHYFHSLYESSYGRGPIGSQPPITRASKQTRDEALPLFYSRCCFSFTAWIEHRGVDLGPRLFVRNTLAQHFARIQFLEVTFHPLHDQEYTITVYISINNQNRSVSVTGFGVSKNRYLRGDKFTMDGPRAVMQKLQELLMKDHHPIVQRIAARPGWEKLRKNDFIALVVGVSDSIRQASENAS